MSLWIAAWPRGRGPFAVIFALVVAVATVTIGTIGTPAQDDDDGAVEPALHTLTASHYFTGRDWASTLTLNNKGPNPKVVVPTLYSLRGQSYSPGPVAVPANGFVDLDLRPWVRDAGAPFRFGSISVAYLGADLEMGAQVRLVHEASGLIFDEQLVEPAVMFASSTLHAAWWAPRQETSARLALANTTDQTVNVTLEIAGGSETRTRRFRLPPRQGRAVQMADFAARYGQVGGFTVSHDAAPGAILARGLLSDATVGYSASLEFLDPGNAKSARYHGAGLRLADVGGTPVAPAVVAYNAGMVAATVTGRMRIATPDGTPMAFEFPQARLEPGEARRLDLFDIWLRARVFSQEPAGIEFDYNVAPGPVVLSATSVSADLRHAIRVPLTDPLSPPSATGGYPWRVTASSGTVVYLKNTTNDPHDYVLQLSYPGGLYSLGVRTLDPGATATVDIRALRDTQAADDRGHRIPATATAGQVHWSIRGPQKLGIIGRAEDLDATLGLSSSYACVNCCPDSYAGSWLSPSRNTDTVGGHSDIVAWQHDDNCYGSGLASYIIWSPSWSSANTRIATIDGSGTTTGRRGGSTTLTGAWTAYSHSIEFGGELGPFCVTSSFRVAPAAQEEVVQTPAQLVLYDDDSFEYWSFGRYMKRIHYQVADQSGAPVRRRMRVAERLWMESDGCNIGLPTARSSSTNSTGQFIDRVGVGEFIPSCSQSSNNRNCTTRIGQSWTADGHAVGTYTVAFRCTGVGVTKR